MASRGSDQNNCGVSCEIDSTVVSVCSFRLLLVVLQTPIKKLVGEAERGNFRIQIIRGHDGTRVAQLLPKVHLVPGNASVLSIFHLRFVSG